MEKRYGEFCKRIGVDLSKSKRTKPRKFWELKENISFNKNPKNSISSQDDFFEDKCLTEEDHDCLNQLSTKEVSIFKEALIKVRRGQAKYREDLEKVWDNACAVSGIFKREVLRASHIKPHSKCNPGEHNDVNNGLLLRADLDALFDKGLITFSDEGNMKISPSLEQADRDKLNFHLPHKLRKSLNSKQKEYLAWHFNNLFQK
ncbi:HNH endonuclease [Acetobacteraceae bacterium]|nr:HNH endonuclease [Acetobacteraceae bacterium]